MAKTSLMINIRIEGLNETIRALRSLEKNASLELKEKATELANKMAAKAKAAGISEGSQAALVATTVRAQKDRVPVVVAGGTKRLGSNRKPAYKLLFGSEFGSNSYTQYKPHIGTSSYWFFKTIEDESVMIAKEWLEAADEIIRKFSE